MLFSRRAQAALTILSTFALAQARSSNIELQFDTCVSACVVKSGCASNDVKCMCTSAREDSFLDVVAQCLYFHCIPELRQFDGTFMDVIVDGCKKYGKAIPQDDIDTAEDTAKLFVEKLPTDATTKAESKTAAATTTVEKPTSTTARALTTMTTSATEKVETTTTESTSTPTPETTQTAQTDAWTSITRASSTEEIAAPTTTTKTSIDNTSQSTTLVMATGSPTKSAAVTSASASAQSTSSTCDSTDPFGNPCPDSAAVRSGMSWVLTGLPVMVALMMR